LGFGLPIIPGNLAGWVINSSDRYLIGLFLGTAFVGYYTPGYILDSMINLFTAPLSFIVTFRDLILECTELDDYSSAEDKILARFLEKKGLKWYILPVSLSHYQDITKISAPRCFMWVD